MYFPFGAQAAATSTRVPRTGTLINIYVWTKPQCRTVYSRKLKLLLPSLEMVKGLVLSVAATEAATMHSAIFLWAIICHAYVHFYRADAQRR